MKRREFLQMAGGSLVAAVGSGRASAAAASDAPIWISTSQTAKWHTLSADLDVAPVKGNWDFDLLVDAHDTFQTIVGFGGCFNEIGAQALAALKPEDRKAILDDLFLPNAGVNLSVCRLPIGANDYALDWYSHDEIEGDFDMRAFSIARDEKLLIPYVAAAKARRPDLKLWASPWSPPTWMKYNRHYAMRPAYPGGTPNGLREDQIGLEGHDNFIQEARYFQAYGLYFRKFADAYRARGLPISMVMPQNEFGSAQAFPSCCWTAGGLARFIPYLGKALEGSDVEIFFGTLEQGDSEIFETVWRDPAAKLYIKGVGVQWGGKEAQPFIHFLHPELQIYQTEQECGNGANDWRYCRYVWGLMKRYLNNGANVYNYWNIVTPIGGRSHWGWAQNSMISVDMAAQTYTYNYEYYLFRHMSQFIKPGAQRVAAKSWNGYDNALAFINPDGRCVVLVQNDVSEPLTMRIRLGNRQVRVTLPADSFNTFVV